jgi:hypothetical protein
VAADFNIKWIDRYRSAKSPANPEYPNGVDVDMSTQMLPSCQSPLPYPAPRCGMYIVTCKTCGTSAVITTSGRLDDPRSVKISCRPAKEKIQ